MTTQPRRILVQKYGGSSVADVEKLGRVADRVVRAKREGYDVVVVVSAMGKTTDGLLALANDVARSHSQAFDPPRRELDMLLSTGERVSMALLSTAIQARGCDAISFTGSQSGILTNDRHFDARIIEVRPHRIEDELARGKIVIVAGYQGMSYRREITTLGRGGSDTTAVALAAALSAERCEIYSDVDGVYSADPRVVADAEHLPTLSATMLQEMAEVGAKVLCAQAVEWARRAKIAIYARSTFTPDDARFTVVVPHESSDAHGARAVVGDTSVIVGSVEAPLLNRLLELCDKGDLPLKSLHADAARVGFWLSRINLPDWSERKRFLKSELDVHFSETLGLVSLVSEGLTPKLWRRFIQALGDANIPVELPSFGSLRASAFVPSDAVPEASRVLHAAFVSDSSAAEMR